MDKIKIKTICCNADPYPDGEDKLIRCSKCKVSLGDVDIMDNPNVVIIKEIQNGQIQA